MDTRSNGTSHESDVIQLERGVSKPDNDPLETAGQNNSAVDPQGGRLC